MADEIEMDPTTGLPKVGPGMFWRVTETLTGSVRVELIQSITIRTRKTFNFLFWDIEYGEPQAYKSENVITWEYVTSEITGDVKLKDLSRDLIIETAGRIMNQMKSKAKGLLLLGDYPPMSLIEEKNDAV